MTDAELLREVALMLRTSAAVANYPKADRLESIAATLERCEQIKGKFREISGHLQGTLIAADELAAVIGAKP